MSEPQTHEERHTLTFPELRLSQTALHQYRSRDPFQSSPFKYQPNQDTSRKLRVYGYGEDGKEVIKLTTNEEGEEKDYLEVVWSLIDSVYWIMQRIEDRIRIPCQYWRLAADGIVIDPSMIVTGVSVFHTMQDPLELQLVPGGEIDDYLLKKEKTHTWKRLAPSPPPPGGSSPLEIAKARYHLINPDPTCDWTGYLERRQAADESLEDVMKEFAGADLDSMLDQIRNGIEAILDGTSLSEREQNILQDSITPFTWETEYYIDTLREAHISSRIHSPTRPASIDVRFNYEYAPRFADVFYQCSVYYYITDLMLPIPPARKSKRDPFVRLDLPRFPFGKSDPGPQSGWKLLYKISLEDNPRGRRYEALTIPKWGLTTEDMNHIYTTLFGDQQLGIDRLDTLRLIFSSVGIPIVVARTSEGIEDEKKLGKFEGDFLDPRAVSNGLGDQWKMMDQYRWITEKMRECSSFDKDVVVL
ncbi:hypothetical protein C8Q75DRAFT_781507 [Abortiporus biennis]|nr:hypothetical protein C8Q75DRAFT_781507 [Abortiporus biennis]